MKRHFLTAILALICTCLTGHAGTMATVTVTLHDGDNEPVVAETVVDLDDRLTLPLILSGNRVWICGLNADASADQLGGSVHATISDGSQYGVQLTLFSGTVKGNFQAGDKVIIFRSGSTKVELEIQPVEKAGGQGGARQSSVAPAPKSEFIEKPKPEPEESSR